MSEQNQKSSINPEEEKIDIRKVIEEENILLKSRRTKLYGEEDANNLANTKFGIALSGGGIRSATINLGFLKTLNCFGLLKRADYISTVSGGGYTGAYIQGTIRNYKSYASKASFLQFEAYQDYIDFVSYQFNDDFKERSDYQDFKSYTPEAEAKKKYEEHVEYARYGDYSRYKQYKAFKKEAATILEKRRAEEEARTKGNQKLKKKKREVTELDNFLAYKEFFEYQSLKNNERFEKDPAYNRFVNSDNQISEDRQAVEEIIETTQYLAYIDNRQFKDYPAYEEFVKFKASPEYLEFHEKSERFKAYKLFLEQEQYQAYKNTKNSPDFDEYKAYKTYRTYLENKTCDYSTIKGYIAFNELFTQEHADYMRARGEYLFPGTGMRKIWNQFVLIVSYIVSLLMSWIAPAIMIILGAWLVFFIRELVVYDADEVKEIFKTISDNQKIILYVVGGLIGTHYLFNILATYHLSISAKFSRVETVVAIIALLAYLVIFLMGIDGLRVPEHIELIFGYLTFGVLLIVLGFISNPNATSLHRFYRAQLAEAFLHFTGSHKNVLLKNLADVDNENDAFYLAPFPLINTCLNLQSADDDSFNGTKTSDYFLLSPLYCGAKLTGYVHTEENSGYNSMTLPGAVTISAAAVNPGMGIYSNKVLSVLTTVLNLRLGYWTWNPKKAKTTYPIVWWPFYFLYELFSRIGTDKKMLNISDGGHIENLAVYELLRRRCKLIMSIDAGADPAFSFVDLENLTIRARNELGVEIKFRPGQTPEEKIRPKPSHGYSEQRFAIADILQIWEKAFDEDGNEYIINHEKPQKTGVLVYIKSSVTAPQGRPEIPKDDTLKYGTYKYKIYHPNFPHEPTSDQFFDPIQWESYFQLGQHIAADVLKLDNWEHYSRQAQTLPLEILFDDFGVHLPYPPDEAAPVADVEEEIEIVERGIEETTAPAEEKTEIKKEIFYKM